MFKIQYQNRGKNPDSAVECEPLCLEGLNHLIQSGNTAITHEHLCHFERSEKSRRGGRKQISPVGRNDIGEKGLST